MPDIREAAIASIPASAGRKPRFDLHTPARIPEAHHFRQRALPTGNYDQVNLALALGGRCARKASVHTHWPQGRFAYNAVGACMTVELVAVSDRLPTDRVVHCVQTAPFTVSLRRRNYGMWRGMEDADGLTSSCYRCIHIRKACAWVAWFALLWACHGHPSKPSSFHRHRSCRTPCQGCQNQPQAVHPNYLPYIPPAASAIMLERPVSEAHNHLYPSQQSDRSYSKLLPTWVCSRVIVLHALKPTHHDLHIPDHRLGNF